MPGTALLLLLLLLPLLRVAIFSCCRAAALVVLVAGAVQESLFLTSWIPGVLPAFLLFAAVAAEGILRLSRELPLSGESTREMPACALLVAPSGSFFGLMVVSLSP